jgi:hypothetical protein
VNLATTSLVAVLSALVIAVAGCGGNDDESGSTGTGESGGAAAGEEGGAAEKYVEGACVKQPSETSTLPIPTVVDCDDPAATGVLREINDFNKCPGEGFYLGTIEGEEVNKEFCVEKDGS